MSLIERARLTPEERDDARHGAGDGDESDALADAATTKALSTAAEYLEAKYDANAVLVRSTDWYRGYMAAVYDLRLEAAGAKRLQVEAQP